MSRHRTVAALTLFYLAFAVVPWAHVLGLYERLDRSASSLQHYNADMYSAFLLIHSLLRWVVVLAGLVVIARAIGGITGRRDWLPSRRRGDALVQHRAGRAVPDRVAALRLAEPVHPRRVGGHGGDDAECAAALLRRRAHHRHDHRHRPRARGEEQDRQGTERGAEAQAGALIFFGLAMVVILLSIPWPGMPGGRPLLRGLTVRSV